MYGLDYFNRLVKETNIKEDEKKFILEEIEALLELTERARIMSSHAAIYQDMVDKKKEEFVLSIHNTRIQKQKDQKKNGTVYITYATRANGESNYTKANKYEKLIEKLYEKYSKSADILSLEAVFSKTLEERTGDINNSISGKSLVEYQRLWNTYYKNYPIAKLNIKKIGTKELTDHFITIIREHKLTKTQVKNIRIVINMIAKYCLKQELLTHNFTADILYDDLPYKKEAAYNQIKANSFSLKQTKEIIVWAKERINTNKRIHPIYMHALIIGITLGMRYAELHALKWADIDFDEKCIMVNQQRTLEYVYEDGKFKCTGRKDKDTLKGAEEPRPLPMLPDVEEALKAIKEMHLSDEYVFPDGHFRYHTYNNKAKEAAESIGLDAKKYRSHSMRTTAGTNLYNICKDVYQVQTLLGHTSTGMTNKYIKDTDRFGRLKDTMFRTISDHEK